MNRRDAIRRIACASAAVALPARGETARILLGQSAAFSGPAAQPNIDFGSRDHVASNFVDLSMLTEDGNVRR